MFKAPLMPHTGSQYTVFPLIHAVVTRMSSASVSLQGSTANLHPLLHLCLLFSLA